MSNLLCPKCEGTDYFLSQRNMVKGMGWLQRGSIKGIPVCRVCDEIMSSPGDALSYEQLTALPRNERRRVVMESKTGKKLILVYVVITALMLYMGLSFFLSI
jgi:hypothetical protein